MSTCHPLDQFHRLHTEVLTLLDRAKPCLNGRDAGAGLVLTPFRTELTAALHALEAFAQRELFAPLLDAGAAEPAIVCALKAEYIKLGFDYQAYQRKWARADIDAHWVEYRLASLAMLRQMRERMAELHDEIGALYARPVEAIREPAIAG